ncbi:hypothetical protein SNK03_004516 [Fusarium graminearum]|nr:unnamed protein product [Fusarium graminearum]
MNGFDAPQRHFITLCIVIEAFITYVREASLTASEAAWHGSRPNEMRRDEVQPRSDKLMQDPQNPPRRLTPRLRKVQGLVEGQAVHYEILWVSSAIVTTTFSFLTNINEINPPSITWTLVSPIRMVVPLSPLEAVSHEEELTRSWNKWTKQAPIIGKAHGTMMHLRLKTGRDSKYLLDRFRT